MEQEPVLNAHNKEEYPPMHTGRLDTPLKNKLKIGFFIMALFLMSLAGCQQPQADNGDSVTVSDVVDSAFLQDTIDGWLTPYISIRKVIECWGNPDSLSEAVVLEFDGALHQSWFYQKKNVRIDVYGDSAEVAKSRLALSVDGIAVTGPTDCQMSHSISIGDDRERLEQQYHGVINAEYSNDQQLSLGNQMPYWGVIYFFEEGKLVGMYNGSMAE